MKINIKNIANVLHADIEIKGITVIAGKNSTGKSTISKSLFSFFNTFYNINKKISEERIQAINNLFEKEEGYFDLIMSKSEGFQNDYSFFLREVIKLKNAEEVKELIKKMELNSFISDIEGFSYRIFEYISLSEKKILEEIINKHFKNEFSNNITRLRSDEIGQIDLILKDKKCSLKFKNNEVFAFDKITIKEDVVYIDNPFVVDTYNSFTSRMLYRKHKNMGYSHRENLIRQYKKRESSNIIETVITRNELKEVINKIEDILDKKETIIDSSIGENEKLSINNLSSGMKTFYLIRHLIANNTISENGTIILDEPEVHLHPEWQLIFAEIIVILQKEMNLHVLINTHSPYFLRGIQVYSKKHNVHENTKYYNSYVNNDGTYQTEDVTYEVSKIYKQLSIPFQILENEKYDIYEEE